MAEILIYGGSGIISTEIVKRAIDAGHRITMVNRGKRRNFIPGEATCIVADLRAEPLDALKEKITGNYDTVIDFLSYTRPELIRNMELARGRCRQYIFVSSATVYDPKEGRYSETDPIGSSEWEYAREKAACEQYLREHAAEHDFAYTVIRPYVTYGKTRIPLQFAPVEYYTVIHRMKHGKPIPLLDRDAKCTLTHSRDFAVAAAGLIGNPDAFGQAFHITGSYETTWADALQDTAEAFDLPCRTVRLPEAVFRSRELMRGMNGAEVFGDKGRDMLFNNEKIRSAVPEFTGSTSLKDALPEIHAYFSDTETARVINFAWDGRCDCMLAKSGRLSRDMKRKLKFAPGEQNLFKSRLIYICHRYDLIYYPLCAVKKLCKRLGLRKMQVKL